MPIILAVRSMGRHSWRRTHALVQPARCGSMAAVTVVLDHPVRSLPLVREVRGDERLPQWPPRERCQERRGAGPGMKRMRDYPVLLDRWVGGMDRELWPI